MAWGLTVQSAGEELPGQTLEAWFGPQATFEEPSLQCMLLATCTEDIWKYTSFSPLLHKLIIPRSAYPALPVLSSLFSWYKMMQPADDSSFPLCLTLLSFDCYPCSLN